MRIFINDQEKVFERALTISDLLSELSLLNEGIAIAVNGEVVPRSKHGDYSLKDGDRVEIVKVVGGG